MLIREYGGGKGVGQIGGGMSAISSISRIRVWRAMKLHMHTYAIKCRFWGSNPQHWPLRPRPLPNLQNGQGGWIFFAPDRWLNFMARFRRKQSLFSESSVGELTPILRTQNRTAGRGIVSPQRRALVARNDSEVMKSFASESCVDKRTHILRTPKRTAARQIGFAREKVLISPTLFRQRDIPLPLNRV